MPLFEDQPQWSVQRQPEAAPLTAPTLEETWTAAFRMENDVENAIDLLTKSKFKRDPTFNVMKKLQESPYWEFRDNFVGVGSDDEFTFVSRQIEQEQRDRDVLSRSGWSGVVAGIAAGMFSPTILLPFVGNARGLAAVGRGMTMGLAGATAQEIPLLLNQETRTGTEIGISIGASTLLSGILGGAVGALRKGEREVLEAELSNRTILKAIPSPAGVGADVPLKVDAGGPVGKIVRRIMGALDTNALTRSPVTYNLTGESAQARWRMAQLADGGMSMEGNAGFIPTTPGGTAENRINFWWGGYARGMTALDEQFLSYRFEGAPPVAARLRAGFADLTGQTGGKMSRAEFTKEITKAGWNNDQHANPFIAAAAKAIRKEIYDPLLKEAQESGMIKELGEITDPSYINRVYNHEAIRADVNGFVSFLEDKFNQKYQAQFAEQLEKFELQQGRTRELVEDLKRPQEEIDELRERFEKELSDIDELEEREHLTALDDTLAGLRSMLREAPDNETKTRIRADIKDMEQGAPLYKNTKERKRELKRRLSNFNKAQVAVEEKLAKKVEKIERSEELSLNSLRRATFAVRKILDNMDKWSDEKLDAELSALKTRFAKEAERFDRSEERMAQLAGPDLKTELKVIEKRAQEQGYTTIGYHGSGEVINRFSPSETKLQRGVFFSDDPRLASRFAEGGATDMDANVFAYEEGWLDFIRQNAGDTVADTYAPKHARYLELSKKKKLKKAEQAEINELGQELEAIGKQYTMMDPEVGGAPNVSKVRLKLGKNMKHEFAGRFDWDEEEAVVAKARAEGYDSITFTLKPIKEGDAPEVFHSVLKEDNIRFLDDPLSEEILQAAELRQLKIGDKLTGLSERIADAEDLGRDAVRDLLDDMINVTLTRAQRIVERRAVRIDRLKKAAKALDPKTFDARVKSVEDTLSSREGKFIDRTEKVGGVVDDIVGWKVNFKPQALKDAQAVKDKILGTYLRLPTIDIMQGERGPALARLLDIPSIEMEKWLETDIEKLTKVYTRTLGADVEIQRKFGTINGDEIFRPMFDEMNAQLQAVEARKDKKGEPLSPEAKSKELIRIQNEYARYKNNLEGVIGRLRGTWGLPSDFDGMGFRMAQTVMHLNVLRYMGGVTISSLPDVARPIMRYGLTRSYKDGYGHLVGNLKALKMSAQEARWAGVAIDAITSQRANSIFETLDDLGRGSKFERGVEYASGKQGLVAVFNYWTDAMKGLTSAIANAKILDSVMQAVEGKPSKATMEFLAANGIDHTLAERIAKQVRENAGGGKVEGVWLPQTERWTDQIALRAYRAALAREVNNTIVTPGVERSLWTNATTTGRLLSQFKSFALSSTYKTVLAGMQQRDTNFLQGVMISLAMGTFSYYVYSLATPERYKRMQEAGLDKWADEAIQRSGLLGVLGLAQDITSRIPATAKISSFSGGRSARRGGDDLIEALMGPTFDFAKTSADVITEANDPTASTAHKMRQLLPWQNVSYLSYLFDTVEQSLNLKERR